MLILVPYLISVLKYLAEKVVTEKDGTARVMELSGFVAARKFLFVRYKGTY